MKIWEGIRLEGVNCGLPMTFVELSGLGLNVRDSIQELVPKAKYKWICILGRDTTRVGMGTFVKGLSSIGLLVELECDGSTREPGWIHSVDRWVVDYSEDSPFNYFALRQQDMVRFKMDSIWDLETIKEGLEKIKICPATKYIKTSKRLANDLSDDILNVIGKYERVRLFEC